MPITFQQSRDQIAALVAVFTKNREAYRSPTFKEAQARTEFIDPFFIALGWDVHNQLHASLQYREVVVEDTVEIQGEKKAPDYAFRVGPDHKFFAEAKRPGIGLKTAADPAYQLRRYAWSKKLPLSILTDFEELAVYDCRVRPAQTDRPSIARLLYLSHTDYLDHWREIWGIFSREAVWGGSFDQYVQSSRSKRGTSEVDAEFLKEIEGWRNILARNIALRNPALTIDELNDAVQRTIDRIIFLRMAEDKGIEPYGVLRDIADGEGVYASLIALARKADAKYNSGLFDFSHAGDQITPNLAMDDKPLRSILSCLYYPQSPYEFSVLAPEILGNVYEQFLGKVIRLTPAHQAKVEEKPEVKKAGGVYYTPTPVVNYIVASALGVQIQGKSPRQLTGFRVLDMACGSGSFLLSAYQCLLDHALTWYSAHDPKRHSDAVWQHNDGSWRLTITEKKRILTEHIFGVDIDRQAVEVTKLSLLLKVLEGEKQLELFRERALPNLDRNVKCGNSVIRPDYFAPSPDLNDLRRINPFDWAAGFPQVIQAGGFDCVIGNPPYLFLTQLDAGQKQYFFREYTTVSYRFDIYGVFIEEALRRLVRPGGYLSFIIPHTILSNDSFEKLRRYILENTHITLLTDIGPGVFQSAKNETMVFVLVNGVRPDAAKKTRVILTNARQFPNPVKESTIHQDTWSRNPGAAWLVKVSQDESSIVSKMDRSGTPLGQFCTVNQGLRTGNNQQYLSNTRKSGKWKPAAGGKQVARYCPLPTDLFVYYDPSVLDAPRRAEIFESPEKIVVQEIRNITLPRRIVATYDPHRFYCLQSTNVINLRPGPPAPPLKFVLGILNSNAVNYYFRQRFSGNNHIASNQLAQIPIPTASASDTASLVQCVESILDLHARKSQAQDAAEAQRIARLVQSTDTKIDELVYRLYGLTDEEAAAAAPLPDQ